MAEELTIGDDVIEGAAAIARFLWGDHAPAKRVYRAIASGQLPIYRIGNRICARKSTLRRWIEGQEANAA